MDTCTEREVQRNKTNVNFRFSMISTQMFSALTLLETKKIYKLYLCSEEDVRKIRPCYHD